MTYVAHTVLPKATMPTDLETLSSLPYRPVNPRDYRPAIGLIGCGGISKHHLEAYAAAGYDVKTLCDLDLEVATAQRDKFFPDASVCSDYRDLLRDDDIQVVDIATHPPERPVIIEAALLARKHVLSQKPFVLDLDIGQRLVELATQQDRYLAVNQNGRWAPHFSYARLVAQQGIIGQVFGRIWDVIGITPGSAVQSLRRSNT